MRGLSRRERDGRRAGEPVRFELRNEDGTPNTARDFTIGILKGGATHGDIVRRIIGGLPGSPMPATELPEQSEQAAMLAAYVRSLIKPGAEERVRPAAADGSRLAHRWPGVPSNRATRPGRRPRACGSH